MTWTLWKKTQTIICRIYIVKLICWDLNVEGRNMVFCAIRLHAMICTQSAKSFWNPTMKDEYGQDMTLGFGETDRQTTSVIQIYQYGSIMNNKSIPKTCSHNTKNQSYRTIPKTCSHNTKNQSYKSIPKTCSHNTKNQSYKSIPKTCSHNTKNQSYKSLP